MSVRRVWLSVLVSLSCLSAPVFAQGGAYIVRLGNDTIAVEKFTRTATHLDADLAMHLPRAALRHYSYDFTAGGVAMRGEATSISPSNPSAPVLSHTVTAFVGDSAFSESDRDTATTRRRVGFPHGAGVVPVYGPFSLWEVLALKQLHGFSDSTVFTGYALGQQGTYDFSAWKMAGDSLGLATPWDVYHAKVDRDGRILGWIPHGGTQQWAVTRVNDVDVRGFAARWAAAESAQQGAWLSPRDTVRASVGGAQLLIDYGRPTKRGRVIFGNVVPWGSTWRTGANAATQFRTDHALEMGGVVIPAGFYTLWSVPTQGGWSLIINGETGQWGTEHKDERDLYRLPMQVSSTTRPVEQFTISVVPSASGGSLILEWDTMRASIPFAVR